MEVLTYSFTWDKKATEKQNGIKAWKKIITLDVKILFKKKISIIFISSYLVQDVRKQLFCV